MFEDNVTITGLRKDCYYTVPPHVKAVNFEFNGREKNILDSASARISV